MKIDLTALKKFGSLPFDCAMPLEEGLLDRKAKALSPLRLRGTCSLADGTVWADGRLTLRFEAPCDRCLKPVRVDLDLPFREAFAEEGDPSELYLYEGDELDLSKAARDALVLNLPSLVLCREDCKGLCPVCGRDRNTESCNCSDPAEEVNPFAVLKQLQDQDKS